MALEDILKRIESEAEEQKKSIIEKAREEADKLVEHARKDIDREAQDLLKKRKRESELIVQRETAQANMTGRNLLGRVKSDALRQVREKLFQAFVDHVESNYEAYCMDLISSNSIGHDEEVLMAPPEARSLGEELVRKLNKDQKSSFSFGGETKDIERGFLLRKGGMMVNLSFSSLLEDVFREYEKEVAGMLFREEEA